MGLGKTWFVELSRLAWPTWGGAQETLSMLNFRAEAAGSLWLAFCSNDGVPSSE